MKQVFINLPVENIEISMDFYTKLGFSNKPLFSDDRQKCMVWSDHIYVMLMSHEQFRAYSNRDISNERNINAYFTLPVQSLEKVNKIVDSGLEAGGKEPSPMIDEGFMQVRKIEDLDGHSWHIVFMDLAKFRKGV